MNGPSSVEAVTYESTLFVRDTCLCLHVQRAARALARRFDEALRPVGLKSGQFSLLISLNRPEPPSIGAVARLLGMDRTTLTANLKPLERDGLLALRPDETDGRTRRLVLTDAGRAVVARALPVWAAAHRLAEAGLVSGNPDRLRADLEALGLRKDRHEIADDVEVL